MPRPGSRGREGFKPWAWDGQRETGRGWSCRWPRMAGAAGRGGFPEAGAARLAGAGGRSIVSTRAAQGQACGHEVGCCHPPGHPARCLAFTWCPVHLCRMVRMRLTCLGPREAHRLGQGPLPSGSRGLQVQVCRPPVGVGGHKGGLGDWMTPRPGSSPGGFTVGGSAGNFQVLLTPPPRKEPDPSPCCPQLPRARSVCPSVHLGPCRGLTWLLGHTHGPRNRHCLAGSSPCLGGIVLGVEHGVWHA